MARPLRVEYPGAFYHVINRGNVEECLFRGPDEKKQFLEYLQQCVDRFSLKVHTYCLMDNRCHLLVETPLGNLSKAIQWINVSYATAINRERHRWGHLFRGRFRSILLDANEYFSEVSRYIHLDPVRAKLATRASEYRWSSYQAVIGRVEEPAWLETGSLLSRFGDSKETAARNYDRFVDGVDVSMIENPDKEVVNGFILGSAEFVKWVKGTFLAPRSSPREKPKKGPVRRAVKMETVVDAVALEFGCGDGAILARGRKKNTARDVAIYLARDLTGETGETLGRCFGGISGSGITMQYKRFLAKMARDRQLAVRVNKIRAGLVEE